MPLRATLHCVLGVLIGFSQIASCPRYSAASMKLGLREVTVQREALIGGAHGVIATTHLVHRPHARQSPGSPLNVCPTAAKRPRRQMQLGR